MPFPFWYRLLLRGVVCAVFWTSLSFAQSDLGDLRELLAQADSTSPVLANARAQLATARAAYTSARALPNPSLFLNHETIEGGGTGVEENTIGIRQNLGFLWTQSSRWSSAKSAYEAASASYEERRRELHTDILLSAERYEQLRMQRVFLDSLSGINNRLVETAVARLKVGDISAYDAERIQLEQIELDSRKAELIQTEQAELIRLMELTGLPAADVEGARTAYALASPFQDEGAALNYAREHRHRLRELELAAKSAAKSVAMARMNVLPDLNFGIGQKTVDPDLDGIYLEADLEIPIFGQRRSAVQQAHAEKSAADIRVSAGRRVVEQEVRSAFEEWQHAQRLASLDTDQTGRAKRNLKLAEELYLNGETGTWELIDALRTSIDALIAAHNLELTRIRAALELRRVTGYPLLEN